jgi:AP-4 complex subunit epsilon-1
METLMTSMSSKLGLSSEFFELVKAISEARSKQEEDAIIRNELRLLQSHFKGESNAVGGEWLASAHAREWLVRLMYCHMLGFDVEFALVHALNFTQQSSLLHKRTGRSTNHINQCMIDQLKSNDRGCSRSQY